MSHPHRVDSESSINSPDESAILPNSDHLLSSNDVAQEDAVGLHHRGQDTHMHGLAYQGQTYRSLKADYTLYSGGSLTGIQYDIGFPFADFTSGLESTNDPNGLCLGAETMMLQNHLATVPNNQFGEWSWESGNFLGSLAGPSSVLAPIDYPAPDQTAMTKFDVFDGLRNVGMQNAEILDQACNQALLGQLDPCPTKHIDSSEQLTNTALTDFYAPDSHDSLSVLERYQFPEEALTGGYWGPGLDGVTMNTPFRAPPNDMPPDTLPPTQCNSLAALGYSYLLSNGIDRLEQSAKTRKVQTNHSAVAGPSFSRNVAIPPDDGGKSLPRRNERGGRRRSRALKRGVWRACVLCHIHREKCIGDGVCSKCPKRKGFPFYSRLCHKGSLEKYRGYFSSDFLCGHLTQSAVDKTTSILAFVGEAIPVEMSTGPRHPPIPIRVYQFIPPNLEFLLISNLSSSNDRGRGFATISSLPYAIPNCKLDQLKLPLLKHVEDISTCKHLLADSKSLSGRVLRAICRLRGAYPTSRENNLLQKAIMINRIHYIKGRQFTFRESSVPKVLENLQNPPKDLQFWASRILTRQLKGALKLIEDELSENVLCEFDKELKLKGPGNWLLCLPVALLLDMCVEEIQVHVDGFVRHEVSNQAGDPAHIYESGERICCHLEEFAEHSFFLLKGKLAKVLKEKNPLKYGLPPGGNPRYTEPMVKFVNELHQIIVEFEDDIREKVPILNSGGSKIAGDHKGFRKQNDGRVVSKLLKCLKVI